MSAPMIDALEETTPPTKSARCVEEYAHFRYMGVSRELTITHLAKVYDTTPAYLTKICKENAA